MTKILAIYGTLDIFLLRKQDEKEERFILAQDFLGFSPWSLGPIAFGPVVSQQIMAKAHGESVSSLFISLTMRERSPNFG
jgi:hypothetical protein